MSEAEKRKRADYKRNRKKWIFIQLIALAVVAALSLGCFLVFDRMNQTYYIEYSEGGSIGYKVQYKDNGFYDDEWIGSGQSYVTELINSISADFDLKG